MHAYPRYSKLCSSLFSHTTTMRRLASILLITLPLALDAALSSYNFNASAEAANWQSLDRKAQHEKRPQYYFDNGLVDFTQRDTSDKWLHNKLGVYEEGPFLGIEFHSGLIHVGRAGGKMFYWYFPNVKGSTSMDIPLIIWLTGGWRENENCSFRPWMLLSHGRSSGKRSIEVGYYLKAYCIRMDKNGTAEKNPYAWNQVADIVFIDQPLGTGFSSVGDPRNYVTNEKTVAEDLREFLSQFIDRYPYLKQRPFYITGESYAGHYIPALAHSLVENPIEDILLKGIAIGNGWVDPVIQYPAYALYALEHNLVGDVGFQIATQAYRQCVELIQSGAWPIALIQCNAVTQGLIGKHNPYDVRLFCDTPPMCYNTTMVETFLNKPLVQQALGIHKPWKECNGIVYMLMMGDWMLQTRTRVGELLKAGLQVLIYNGDEDFICNWRGGLEWTNNIDWIKKEEFASQKSRLWTVGRNLAGEIKNVENLTFLRIFKAGHMVPMDQPEVALEMMRQFLNSTLGKDTEFAIMS